MRFYANKNVDFSYYKPKHRFFFITIWKMFHMLWNGPVNELVGNNYYGDIHLYYRKWVPFILLIHSPIVKYCASSQKSRKIFIKRERNLIISFNFHSLWCRCSPMTFWITDEIAQARLLKRNIFWALANQWISKMPI